MADGTGTDARAELEANRIVGGGTGGVALYAAQARPAPLTPMEMIGAALERGSDLTVLEKLMDLQERHERNEMRRAFDAAMAAALAEMPVIVKNKRVGFESKNGGGRTDYAHEDLGEIARVVGPVLSKHGLSYRFRTANPIDRPITVTCIISHAMGYSEENTLEGPRDASGNKNALQQIGSTVTYLQRYTLKAALGLASATDDDGQAAGGDGPISQDQFAELQALLDKSGADTEKLCAYFKVEALVHLPQSKFQNAKAALQAKVAAKKKAAKETAP